jgi:hypothetical protein
MEYAISVLSTKLHKHDDFHEDWIWLDAEDGDRTCASVDKDLATRDVSSVHQSCDYCEGGSGRREK